jgi:hypothetical protein
MKENNGKRPKIGRPPVHAGYSPACRAEIVGKNKELQRYLRDCREGLVLDLGKTEADLSEGQRILVDRIISKLSLTRVLELSLAKHGIFKKDAGKTLEAEPVTSLWLSVNNGIRADLSLLGIERRDHGDGVIDFKKYIEIKKSESGEGTK